LNYTPKRVLRNNTIRWNWFQWIM